MIPPRLVSITAGSVNGRIQQAAHATAAAPDIMAAPTTLPSGAATSDLALQPQPGSSWDGNLQMGAFSITLM
jgi:hypothetical protein